MTIPEAQRERLIEEAVIAWAQGRPTPTFLSIVEIGWWMGAPWFYQACDKVRAEYRRLATERQMG